MPELYPSQSEGPLPNSLGYLIPDKQMLGTLGELVVTDQRDPFSWLATKPYATPSESAKHFMWAMYRMDGHLPDDETQEKYRDKEDVDELIGDLSIYDKAYIDAYQKHLVRLDAEESVKKLANLATTRAEQSSTRPVLHEPNAELLLFAINEHFRILEEKNSKSGKAV